MSTYMDSQCKHINFAHKLNFFAKFIIVTIIMIFLMNYEQHTRHTSSTINKHCAINKHYITADARLFCMSLLSCAVADIDLVRLRGTSLADPTSVCEFVCAFIDCARGVWFVVAATGEVPRDCRPISMFIIARQSCMLCSPACDVDLSCSTLCEERASLY